MKLLMLIMLGFFLFVAMDLSIDNTYYKRRNGVTYQYKTFFMMLKHYEPIDSTYNILTEDQIYACEADERMFKKFK